MEKVEREGEMMDIKAAIYERLVVEAGILKLLEEYAEKTGLAIDGLEFSRIEITMATDSGIRYCYNVSVKVSLP